MHAIGVELNGGDRCALVVSSNSYSCNPLPPPRFLLTLPHNTRARTRTRAPTHPHTQDNDTYYFSSYGHFGIHETMLRDRVRTLAYKEAIEAHAPSLLRGRVVMDVGCGSGVLSMFAAKAGAARVVGVDRSDIIETARAIVGRNGLQETVALVKGKVEELGAELAAALGPGGKADVIVSEWMGYCLLYESMLPSVLAARDKFLAPGGWLMPNRCTMRVEGVKDLGGRLAWWDDVYGLDMAPLRTPMVAEPAVEVVDAQAVVTDGCVLKDLDLMTVSSAELDFGADFALRVTKGGSPLAGLVVSFDTFFEGPEPGAPVVSFSTGPEAAETHWRQTLFWLRGAPGGPLQEGDAVEGRFQFRRNAENPRDYDIEVTWMVRAEAGGKVLGQGQQMYQLGT
jgi:predicted RNA methylase